MPIVSRLRINPLLGTLIVVAVLLLGAAIGANLQQEQPSGGQGAQSGASQSQDHTAPQQKVPVDMSGRPKEIGPGTADSGDTEDAIEYPQAEYERSKADLEAQQEMAQWAFWMVIVSGVSAAIAAFAVGLLYLTLKETRRATKAATDAAGAAQDTVAVTREIAQAQLRAYVLPVSNKLREEGGSVKIRLGFKNFGQTPAHSIESYAFSCVSDSKPGISVMPLPAAPLYTQPFLAPGVTFSHTTVVEHSLERAIEVFAKPDAFYTHILIRYCDVFGNSWMTRVLAAYNSEIFRGKTQPFVFPEDCQAT